MIKANITAITKMVEKWWSQ